MLRVNYLVTSRWILKIKLIVDVSLEKYKVRLMTIGFSYKGGLDNEETTATISEYASIRVVIYISSEMKWRIHHMDVKIVFHNWVI